MTVKRRLALQAGARLHRGVAKLTNHTSNTAAIVVSRRCFIMCASNLLITNDLIFECFLGHTFGHTFRLLHQKPVNHSENAAISANRVSNYSTDLTR